MQKDNYFPWILVFVTGYIVMTFELSGVRLLGPFLGTSVFVWSSLIGIVMGCLSLGYWLGGRISLKKSTMKHLAWVLAGAAFFIFLTAFGGEKALARISRMMIDFRWMSVVSCVLLFGPANVFMGMVLPMAARLKISHVSSSGKAVGNLYALSTAGSIAGTFISGFLFIPAAGFEIMIYVSALILLVFSATSLIVSRSYILLSGLTLLSVAALVVFLKKAVHTKDYVDADTLYNRVLIYDTKEPETGRKVRVLKVNNETSSAMYLDGEGLVFEVLKYYRLAGHFYPGFRHSLMIGGSGYAFPKDYLQRFPDATLDVVEIDPALTRFAAEYFGLKEHPALKIFHEDGRTYINRTESSYDVIFLDAYKSLLTVPYQLTTLEAVEKMHAMLTEKGVLFANIISTFDVDNNHFLRAAVATYKQVFGQVYLFAVKDPGDSQLLQNFMLVALKSYDQAVLSSSDPEYESYLQHIITHEIPMDIPALTDDYAPVDYYTNKMIRML
ncbi:MAG: fused MFS/spermidine synthase [Bacteroidales bacterium]|nr:fused MFS/spermidine synthase [Bacteroidales bacterium]